MHYYNIVKRFLTTSFNSLNPTILFNTFLVVNSFSNVKNFCSTFRLGNPRKDLQRVSDAIVLIFSCNWSKWLLNFENVVETPFQFSHYNVNCEKLKIACFYVKHLFQWGASETDDLLGKPMISFLSLRTSGCCLWE